MRDVKAWEIENEKRFQSARARALRAMPIGPQQSPSALVNQAIADINLGRDPDWTALRLAEIRTVVDCPDRDDFLYLWAGRERRLRRLLRWAESR
jgi:hypothetical protein